MLDVPVLDVRQAGWVVVGTGLAVLFGAGWVLWCLLAPVALLLGGDAAKTKKRRRRDVVEEKEGVRAGKKTE